MHTFFIAPTGFGVGLTSISLGLVGALAQQRWCGVQEVIGVLFDELAEHILVQ